MFVVPLNTFSATSPFPPEYPWIEMKSEKLSPFISSIWTSIGLVVIFTVKYGS